MTTHLILALLPQDTSSHRPRMKPNTEPQVGRVWSKLFFHFLRDNVHGLEDVPSETSHDHCVILARIWETTCGYITVADSLDPKYAKEKEVRARPFIICVPSDP
jgi:hypothetical protein